MGAAVTLMVLVAIGWQALGDSLPSVRLLISTPARIAAHMHEQSSERFSALLVTATESLLGLAIATVIALALFATFIRWPRLAPVVYPWLVASQVIPLIALAPLVIILLGTGPSGKVAMSALMTFFPILSNLLVGLWSIPEDLLDDMRLRHASQWTIIRHVIVPCCLRSFFAGLRIAGPASVIGAIVAEFNGAEQGTGKDIFIAARRLEPELMMASIGLSGLLAGGVYSLVRLFELIPGKWYRYD